MPDSLNRVVIDRVDWKCVLPVLRLASAFKHALQPGKLVVALFAVLAIHLSGTVLDWMWFGGDEPGLYTEITGMYADGAEGLVQASLALNFSVDEMNGVPNILGRMVLGVPAMLFQEHPWFMLLFGADVLFVFAMASGILTRMSATQVCTNQNTTLGSAACSVHKRWVWYLLTPLMPAALIVVVGGVLALAGLVFFNIPGVDVVGALGYGLWLILGFVVAVVALLLLLALFLMPPALSVEGSDGFDAIARSFNYILFRPWQFAVYLFSSIVYLAVVYVLVGAVASISIDATQSLIDIGAFTEADDATYTRFEVITDQVSPRVDQGVSTDISHWIVARWFELVTAIVIAILFSTFCCLQTQVYVLMRRSADGTPMDQCDGGVQADLWGDKPATEQSADVDASKVEG